VRIPSGAVVEVIVSLSLAVSVVDAKEKRPGSRNLALSTERV
jgi:hypothetical protein